ncbi:MAG: aldose epimerase family protein [candidate division KSB1 bacterium]|nr:aldose epimerase family protein [candidate division KSB1 bacterium]
MSIEKQPFGTTLDGTDVSLYTLTNENGMQVKITNYGGTVTSILVPDKQGNVTDVVLGFDDLGAYIKDSPYFGCIIGRFGNRIAGGQFKLDDKVYKLAVNNGPNHLHGGEKGFDKQVWDVVEHPSKDGGVLELHYHSPDGEENYPGNLDVVVSYTLTAENEIVIRYRASTDQKTLVNLTNHTYFNLKDAGKSDVLNHVLELNADHFTPINEKLIPLGKIQPVQGTPMGFTQPKPIGQDIDQDDEQLKRAGGYDHNFVIKGKAGDVRFVARVTDPQSGRMLEVYSKEPGVQFYSGNFLDGTLTGKQNTVYQKRHGFCLETRALSGFSEPAGISVDRAAARRSI